MAFAYGNAGFALKDITPYFENFQPGIPPPAFDGMAVRKGDHFIAVLSAMHPRNQRLALIELCCNPPVMKNCPDEQAREELLRTLIQSDGKTPLAIALSRVSLAGLRDQWWTATSRLTTSASSAITAARSMFESTCKTILTESGEVPDNSGDMQRLFSQTRDNLGLKTGPSTLRSANEVISGFISVMNGVAAISNDAGDRHGQVAGARLEHVTIASLCLHSAGISALFLAQTYLEHKYLSAFASKEF